MKFLGSFKRFIHNQINCEFLKNGKYNSEKYHLGFTYLTDLMTLFDTSMKLIFQSILILKDLIMKS